MEYGAIDLHARQSLIRIVTSEGTVVLERTIPTRADKFLEVFGARASLRVVVESSTESEWVAQCLERCGHEVVVVDPNYALMYGHRGRHIKTDRRDVTALAEANRRGLYRAVHRVSAAQRQRRRTLRIREQLVRTRTQLINLLRAQLRQEGYRLPSGAAEATVARYGRLSIPETLTTTLAPVLTVLEGLAPVLEAADAEATAAAAADPVVTRLMTVPGVGPITGLTFRAALDDVTRFADAKAVSAYLGLVPREDSSGGRRRQGAITKVGPRSVRTLLVQGAWTVWRQRRCTALHAWVEQLAARRGRRIAIVALARRLARILFALWRDGTTYQAVRLPVSRAAHGSRWVRERASRGEHGDLLSHGQTVKQMVPPASSFRMLCRDHGPLVEHE
jgi:transposase